jgi:hypothetical protein
VIALMELTNFKDIVLLAPLVLNSLVELVVAAILLHNLSMTTSTGLICLLLFSNFVCNCADGSDEPTSGKICP